MGTFGRDAGDDSVVSGRKRYSNHLFSPTRKIKKHGVFMVVCLEPGLVIPGKPQPVFFSPAISVNEQGACHHLISHDIDKLSRKKRGKPSINVSNYRVFLRFLIPNIIKRGYL